MRCGNTTSLYFINVLKAKLIKLNLDVVDEFNNANVMRKLSMLKSTLVGNQEVLTWMRGEKLTFIHRMHVNTYCRRTV